MNTPFQASLALLLVTWLAVPVTAMPVSDVMGDTVPGSFATYDITSINAVFSSTTLTFTVMLTSNPLAPSAAGSAGLAGFIDIDIDQNPFSGASSNISSASSINPAFGSSGLGVEFYLDLFSESAHSGFVDVNDPLAATTVGTAPITYGTNQFSIAVPLSLLANDDGFVNYAVLVGDGGAPTDQAVDAGLIQAGGLPASSSPVPVPAALWLLISALVLGLRGRKRSA